MILTYAILSEFKAKYDTLKVKHPDALLLFKVDNYADQWIALEDDAEACHDILGLPVHRTTNGSADPSPLISYIEKSHDRGWLDTALPKLVRAGRRIAICEQYEDPRKRKVVRDINN